MEWGKFRNYSIGILFEFTCSAQDEKAGEVKKTSVVLYSIFILYPDIC